MTGRPRAGACFLAGVAVLVFLWLVSNVWRHDSAVLFDDRAARWVTGDFFDRLFGSPERKALLPPAAELVRMGSREAVGAAAILLALLAFVWRDRWAAVMAVAVPIVVGALTQYLLKPIVNNSDPQGPRAFPSGHAGGITAIALVAAVVLVRHAGPKATGLAAPLLLLPVLLVGVCLLKLQFHHATDVAGGVALAVAVASAAAALLAPPVRARR